MNLLNHPLQLQLATGELPFGSFQRLVEDRKAILEGIEKAISGGENTITDNELYFRDDASRGWLQRATEAGKTIESLDGIKCYNCGGPHLNIDCPEDLGASQSARALASTIQANGVVGAAAVLRCYSYACDRLLRACTGDGEINEVYHGWIVAHAEQWSKLADFCEEKADASAGELSYSICISMLYNWIDSEAATTGIRADLNDPRLSGLIDRLEELEPGYAASRDKHASFIADITGKASSERRVNEAEAKVNAAAAYLASKRKESSPAEKAAAYLAAKKKAEREQ